jgi:hypothetical protein
MARLAIDLSYQLECTSVSFWGKVCYFSGTDPSNTPRVIVRRRVCATGGKAAYLCERPATGSHLSCASA